MDLRNLPGVRLLALVALVSCSAVAARADLARVTDPDGLLTRSEREALGQAAAALGDKRIDCRLGVLRSFGTRDRRDFAREVFRTSGMGSSRDSMGLLVLASADERALEIEVDARLSGELPPDRLGALADAYAGGRLSGGNLAGGLTALVGGVTRYLVMGPDALVEVGGRPVAAPATAPSLPRSAARKPSLVERAVHGALFLVGFLFDPHNAPITLALIWTLWAFSLPMRHLFADRRFAAVGGMIAGYAVGSGWVTDDWGQAAVSLLFMAVLGVPATIYTLTRRCPQCQNGYLEETDEVLREPGVRRRGLGETITDCPECSFHRVLTYPIDRVPDEGQDEGSRSAGEGPHALGGNSSGGGGAGRTW